MNTEKMTGSNETVCDMNHWYSALEKDPGHPAMCDEDRSYCRAEVEEISGKLYAAFRKMGMGKEDVVLIALPRSARVFIAAIAVLKAGAAYILSEGFGPFERFEYIKKDSRCRLVLTEDVYNELIAETPYQKGFAEDVNEHDAAYIVYTSGTTGHPKGIVHERGNIQFSYNSLFGNIPDLSTSDTRFGVICPLSFAAAMLMLNSFLNVVPVLYIVNYDTIKNTDSLIDYLERNRIDQLFITPEYYRLVGEHLPDTVKTVFLGGASAHWISGAGRSVYNVYMSGETGFAVCKYRVRDLLQNVPVGKPEPSVKMKFGEDGEILCKVPYTRGYLHREQDRGIFCDGWYHTGDVGKLDENGDLIILGRKDEMIKIDGNRVEPEEVSSVFSVLTGLPCAVRGFEGDDGQYLVLYYVSDREAETDGIIRQMGDHLPYYMIPSCFVCLDRLPILENGKVSVKDLPVPAKKETPYTAPKTELEKKFCHATEAVLGREHVGIYDDFFELGGGSLHIISMITALSLPGLTAKQFYEGRKLRSVIELYLSKTSNEAMDEIRKETEARKRRYSLPSPVNEYYDHLQIFPEDLKMNLSYAVRLDRRTDIQRFCGILNDYLSASSTFQTRIGTDGNHVPYFWYDPSLFHSVEIEKMTEAEVRKLQNTFVRRFDLQNEYLYRIRLIQTRDDCYLFVDLSHLITDGMGLYLFFQDLYDAYTAGKTIQNNFFAWLFDKDAFINSRERLQLVERIKIKGTECNWSFLIEEKTNQFGMVERIIDPGIALDRFNAFLKSEMITRGVLLTAALALTTAKLCKSRDVSVMIVFSLRYGENNHAGARAESAKAFLHLSPDDTIHGFLECVKREYEFTSETVYAQHHEPSFEERFGSIMLNDLQDITSENRFAGLFDSIELFPQQKKRILSPNPFKMLYFFDHGKSLILKFQFDRYYISERCEKEFSKTITETLVRLLQKDETIFRDYLT